MPLFRLDKPTLKIDILDSCNASMEECNLLRIMVGIDIAILAIRGCSLD